MPQPHEQKLQEVVSSLTLASFNSRVAARTAATSMTPPSAKPTPPPSAVFNHSLRLTGVVPSIGLTLSRALGRWSWPDGSKRTVTSVRHVTEALRDFGGSEP